MKVGVTKRQKEEMTRKRRDRKQFFREKERKRELRPFVSIVQQYWPVKL